MWTWILIGSEILILAPCFGDIIFTLRRSSPFKSVLHYIFILFLIGNGLMIWASTLPDDATTTQPSEAFYVGVPGFLLCITCIFLAYAHKNIDEYIENFRGRNAFRRVPSSVSSRQIRPAVRPPVRSLTSKELREVIWYALYILGNFIVYEVGAFVLLYVFTPAILGVSNNIGGTLVVGGLPIGLIFFLAALGTAAKGFGILIFGIKETINKIKKYRSDTL